MFTTIYFGPYIGGPEMKPAAGETAQANSPRGAFGRFGQSLMNLAPGRQIDRSGMLLVVEVALCAALLGTATNLFGGSSGSALTVMLALDGLMVAWLLVGSFVQTATLPMQNSMVNASNATLHRWAYRVQRRSLAHRSAEIGAEFGSLGSTNDSAWSQLQLQAVFPADLQTGDLVVVDAGQFVLADGNVVAGFATVDESIVTGQSDPALRSADGESAVLRDSRVVNGKLLVEIMPRRGHPLDWLHGSESVSESLAPTALARFSNSPALSIASPCHGRMMRR